MAFYSIYGRQEQRTLPTWPSRLAVNRRQAGFMCFRRGKEKCVIKAHSVWETYEKFCSSTLVVKLIFLLFFGLLNESGGVLTGKSNYRLKLYGITIFTAFPLRSLFYEQIHYRR